MDQPKQPQRHCWECRKRCLVCDFTKPNCRKCSARGVSCSGYGDSKPKALRWLPPGQVLSHRKRSGNLVSGLSRSDMGKHAFVLAEAIEYFNSCMYPSLSSLHELGKNPHVYALTAAHLQRASRRPDYLQNGMICVILSHRMHSTSQSAADPELRERFRNYHSLAAGALSRRLDGDHWRSDDLIIGGIVTLLLAEIQQGDSPTWRWHLEGAQRLIAARGGFLSLAASPSLKSVVLCLWCVSVFANTTCPASALAMTEAQLDEHDMLLQAYSTEPTPWQMCPSHLVVEIIKVNHLRKRAFDGDDMDLLLPEALEILDRLALYWPLLSLDANQEARVHRVHTAGMYKSAVIVYCILSLQSASVLPDTADLRNTCSQEGQRLRVLLQELPTNSCTWRFLIWPLTVLGVDAVHAGDATRSFVSRRLAQLSRELGTYMPLSAKGILELFWTCGETRWESCFQKPVVFTGHIAPDTDSVGRDAG